SVLYDIQHPLGEIDDGISVATDKGGRLARQDCFDSVIRKDIHFAGRTIARTDLLDVFFDSPERHDQPHTCYRRGSIFYHDQVIVAWIFPDKGRTAWGDILE